MDLLPSPPNERRQQRLLVLAWSATLVPLAAFTYLTWQSYQLKRLADDAERQIQGARASLVELQQQAAVAQAQKTELEKQIAAARVTLDEQRESTKHYRDATGVKVQFYRDSDREIVEKALERLGFKVEMNKGASRLINASPNTIAHGTLVSVQDLRDIAVALVSVGFPLKRITRAMVQPDPKLIQIYASAATDRECGRLTEDLVRSGAVCGPK